MGSGNVGTNGRAATEEESLLGLVVQACDPIYLGDWGRPWRSPSQPMLQSGLKTNLSNLVRQEEGNGKGRGKAGDQYLSTQV